MMRPALRARSIPGRAAAYASLGLFALGILLPFAYMACASIKSNGDYFSSLFLPAGDGLFGIAWDRLTLENYRQLFHKEHFLQQIVNSAFLASVTSVLATLGCAMGGYALAKFRFAGRNFFTNLVLAALVIPSTALLAPTYQLVHRIGLLDTMAGVILPAIGPPFGVYLFRQSILSALPSELIEAARIDGCGEIRLFFTIALPTVRPMVSAFLLITFLASWNDFLHPQIILQSAQRFPLSVAVAQLKDLYSQDYGMLMAGSLISILPVMILFLLLQREFIAGLTSGAVKG